MSDFAQGPDWWVASDGKWYPPEMHPSYQPPPPPPPGGGAQPGGWYAPPIGPPGSSGPSWSGPPAAPVGSGMPLHLWAAPPPQPRDRFTCAIRILMVIPQAIVLIFVFIVAYLAMIVAWFVALFTGRLDGGIRDYLAGAVRWSTRVQGYLFFLTDTYPPYSLDEDPAYPIQVAIPPPVELNRLAVLFRLFIAIPGFIVSNVLSSGLFIVSIGSWFMVLVTGELPVSLFEATRTVVRYQARLYAYFSMLTPEYPWGAMGDTNAPPPGVDPYEAWSIRLSSGGRTAMIVVIVLGVIVQIFNRSRY